MTKKNTGRKNRRNNEISQYYFNGEKKSEKKNTLASRKTVTLTLSPTNFCESI